MNKIAKTMKIFERIEHTKAKELYFDLKKLDHYFPCYRPVMTCLKPVTKISWLAYSMESTDLIFLSLYITPWLLVCSIPSNILMVLAILLFFKSIFIEKHRFRPWQHYS